MLVLIPDIELSKAQKMVEEGRGVSIFSPCSCGRHKRLDFYAEVEV